jgi:hypothetical protein
MEWKKAKRKFIAGNHKTLGSINDTESQCLDQFVLGIQDLDAPGPLVVIAQLNAAVSRPAGWLECQALGSDQFITPKPFVLNKGGLSNARKSAVAGNSTDIDGKSRGNVFGFVSLDRFAHGGPHESKRFRLGGKIIVGRKSLRKPGEKKNQNDPATNISAFHRDLSSGPVIKGLKNSF